ncbi:MAG TPA: NUDIX domain-containing protein [Patescibacteria group bacterium]|nr:NUDIX domain-containing protein [Patescibacteria group bacterium]
MITCTFENGKNASLRHVVVHAIVEKDGALLLVKRAPTILEGGKWSLPSGFLDRDETGSEGVTRELKEETGWEGNVESLFFVKTDPHRPHEDRQNISFHYIVTPIRLAREKDWESTEVSWIKIDALPPLESLAFDHGESIGYYLQYRNSKFPLPILDHHEIR